MKYILTGIIAVILVNYTARAQVDDDDVEIGVVEKLGNTIPLDLTFLNENNDTVTLGKLIDRPTILSLVYFDCPGICSPLMSGLSDAIRKMDMELGKDYKILTISFNTRDTPEKAKIKKKNFVQKISKENRAYWVYLTGNQENIDAITNAVGFKYKAQGVDFAHPAVIMALSPKGKITRYLYGKSTPSMVGGQSSSMDFLPFDIKMALVEAQKGIERPTINKILQYCFAYDAAGKTYTLQITRIVGSLIIVIALIIFISLLIRGRRKQLKAKSA